MATVAVHYLPLPSAFDPDIWTVWEIVRYDDRNGRELYIETQRPMCPASKDDALEIATALNLLQSTRDLGGVIPVI